MVTALDTYSGSKAKVVPTDAPSHGGKVAIALPPRGAGGAIYETIGWLFKVRAACMMQTFRISDSAPVVAPPADPYPAPHVLYYARRARRRRRPSPPARLWPRSSVCMQSASSTHAGSTE